MNDELKDISRAMNARLFLLFVGIMMMVNALSVSFRTGTGLFTLAKTMDTVIAEHPSLTDELTAETEAVSEEVLETAKEAATEALSTEGTTEAAADGSSDQMSDEERVKGLLAIGMTSDKIRILAVFFIIQAIVELAAGFISILFCNRVDKAKITFTTALVLVGVEIVIVCLVYEFMQGALMLSSLIYSIVLPLLMLWAANKMRKFAKADPKRVYAVAPGKKRSKGKSSSGDNGASGAAGADRSLRDRAMMKTDYQPEDDASENDVQESAGEAEAVTGEKSDNGED